TPFYEGPFATAVFALFIALLRFVLARPWAEVAAAVTLALYLSLGAPLEPWGAAFASSLAVAGLLLFVFQRFGFASLLVAATSAALFRETLAAFHLWREHPMVFLLGASALAAVACAGAIGVSRPAREDDGRVEAPAYV